MTYLLNGMFDMFKSGTAFWEWLTSASAKTYVIIICVTIALLIAAVIFACCKKARVRKNDVNVLLLLGDDDKSVDAEIYKRNYAMVLVSKNDNTKTAKDREIEQPVLLTDSTDEMAELNDEIVSDVIVTDDEEFIIEDSVTDTEIEDIIEPETEQSEEPEVIEELEEIEPVTDTLAVVDSEEEIPFNEQVDDAEEEEIDELVEEDIDEAIVEEEEEIEDIADAPVEEIVEEEIEELVDDVDEIEVAEIEEPVEEVVEVAEITEDTVEPEIVEIEEDTVADETNENIIVAPIIVDNTDNVEVEVFDNDTTEEVKTEEVVKPEVVIYDIDASEDYARDRIEVVNYIRVAGKVTSETSVIDNEEETVAETVINEVAEEPVAVSEEIFMIETEAEETSEEAETVTPEVVEVEETIVEPEIVDEETIEEPVVEEIQEEIAEEPVEEVVEEVASDIIDETQDSVIIDETEEDKETAAYSIVKEEEAVPEAIEAVQNGEVIVDANGDGVVAEVLVDKNILKARYKTVDLETRLRRAEESTKVFYSELKNFLLSYEGVKSRVSKKFDTFTIGRFIVAKMAVRGNVINLYLALASESIENKYFAEDVGDSDTYGKTPTLHKVKSKRGCKYGIELIRDIMNELQIQANEAYEATDFVAAYPPENIEEKKDAIRYLFKESVSVEELGELSDEDALELIEVVKNKQYTINKFMPINKYVVFVDDLDALYSAGETVTISDLIDKEALPKEENIFLEIRAKGRLNKPLTVEAHSFDPAAIKMIILTDGKVIQYK